MYTIQWWPLKLRHRCAITIPTTTKQHHVQYHTRTDPVQQQQPNLAQEAIQKAPYQGTREDTKPWSWLCHCHQGTTNRGVHSPGREGVPRLETGWSRRTQRWDQINNEENKTTQVKHLQRRSKGYKRIEERPIKNGADSLQGGKHGGYGQRRLWKEIRKKLLSQSTYRVLQSDPTTKQKNKLIALLKTIKAEGGISDNTYRRLYPTGESTPKHYGLPKVHKEGVPWDPSSQAGEQLLMRVPKN